MSGILDDFPRGVGKRLPIKDKTPKANWMDAAAILSDAALAYDPRNPGGKVLLGVLEGKLIGIDDDRHMLTAAGSRAGKGVSVIIPRRRGRVLQYHIDCSSRLSLATKAPSCFLSHAKSRTVIYRSKMHRVRMRNFEVFPVLDWIAVVTARTPNKGEYLLRYYGWYSHVNRGKRTKAQESGQHGSPAGTVAIPPPPGSAVFKQRWAELIKKLYEAAPLLCPRCGGAMRIIAFIDQPDMSENILPHLGLWPHTVHAPPDGVVAS